jgi:hypothetical protein
MNTENMTFIKSKLPGITIPGEATHRYGAVFYRMSYRLCYKRLYEFIEVWQGEWIRTQCHPPVRLMIKIGELK